MNVEVVVPWRAGCPHREAAWGWVARQWHDTFPAWRLTVAQAPEGEWCKAEAVGPAVERSGADVIVVADADVWAPGVGAAVERCATWAVPHTAVRRLTREATAAVFAGEAPDDQPTEERPYTGVAGGGVVVLRRDVATAVPLDRRFRGWGGEDLAWGYALRTLAGNPWRSSGPLHHLWHPPQPRLDRIVGSVGSESLRRRYLRSRRSRARMRALVEEGRIPGEISTADRIIGGTDRGATLAARPTIHEARHATVADLGGGYYLVAYSSGAELILEPGEHGPDFDRKRAFELADTAGPGQKRPAAPQERTPTTSVRRAAGDTTSPVMTPGGMEDGDIASSVAG